MGLLPSNDSDIRSYSNVDIDLLRSLDKKTPYLEFWSQSWGQIIFFQLLLVSMSFSLSLACHSIFLLSFIDSSKSPDLLMLRSCRWHILYLISFLNEYEGIDLGLPEIESVYIRETFWYSHIILKIKTGKPYLSLKSSHIDHN